MGVVQPFAEYQQQLLHYETKKSQQVPVYDFRGPNGVKTYATLLESDDEVNRDVRTLDRTLIRWELNGIGPRVANRLIKLEDLVRIPRKYDLAGRQEFESELGAKMARKKFDYLLDNYKVPGEDGLTFRNAWTDRKGGHLVASKNGYALNIREFPEVYLVYGRPGETPKPITSFDGFFLRRDNRNGQLHVFIVESKIGQMKAKSFHKQVTFFKEHALPGLQAIYQGNEKQKDNAIITYVFCSTVGRIIRREKRQDYLGAFPTYIKQQLEPHVRTLFLPLSETPERIDQMVDHIISQKGAIQNFRTVKVRASPGELLFLDDANAPAQHMVALGKGLWQEVDDLPEDQVLD